MTQDKIINKKTSEETKRFFQKVYAWMFIGLVVSGTVAFIVSLNPFLYQNIISRIWIFISLMILELALVLGLIYFIKRIPANLAKFLFLLYSITTGLTLSVIFLVYTLGSIGSIFFMTAVMFGGMSIYGYYTKKDLTTMGHILIMGLFGIIIASIINLFLNNQLLDYVTSIIGVVIFTGLTAYDTQKIKNINIIGNEGTEEDTKESIIGALTLYLDFINLFLRLLRLFGKRR